MGHLDSIGFINNILTQLQETILSVEVNTLYFDPFGETQSDYLTANVSWSIYQPPTWITVAPSYGTGSVNLIITVQENDSGYDRSGTIMITGGGKTITITVIQYGVPR